MNWAILLKSKTFWTAVGTIAGLAGAAAAGEIDTGQAILGAAQALMVIFLREGVAKK